ncbi:RidA family protein [Herbiconiux ginsengi]|uniref:Enamine deaminase RidA, house cleaning of reactive enamine intermediates, YjgF/YER057c/UK114 family n=1 Tax=Herbiconiux ginsengi TaxID=381665 RepID=A0A1H3KVE4_9MICO|nr:RidA family protein [Herbiconiux ginsengi]SDY55959.1 Enamine deaminase RidA, house cleaning of reactive enamine intermediates, YjgF/YER057c/UK114 family [Herbiconiux ginsengi]
MSRRIVNPPELATPIGFAHGVVAGATVYLGGQTAMDASGAIVPGGIVEQFERAFTNLLTTLRAAGGAPDDLVDVTIYLTDVEDYQRHGKAIGAKWRELAGTDYPAMAGIGVTRLWQPEALIEIQGVAHIGGADGSAM